VTSNNARASDTQDGRFSLTRAKTSRVPIKQPPSSTGKNLGRLAMVRSPKVPTAVVSLAPKNAWAQSSISAIARAAQNSLTLAIGCGNPK
jgi:hypothetical protein